ncbi:hypothetical protein HPP92_003744 [Vanilla planifolia]|uniref:Protein kinase domain-containing protein n=1 Tax=Vanilla planifolia TaxID=51239 RepID=A0A835SH20_VANPL|nr:hypothetical protein HPP92_003744 [Vanilla planifolia]
MSTSMAALSNGNLDVTLQKESRSREQPDINEKAMLLEEVSLLCVKLASLEEELCKSRQEAVDHDQRYCQLEKELKDIKEQDQHMKIKRLKVLSDLLIAVSKSERQEARMKIRQDSLRLGSVGVIRTGTIISETWEDGQALKDINAHLKSLLETKEAVERHRKSLKKRQSDKGDGNDAETSMPEDDFLIQDEICKSRLSSIKREEENLLRERDRYELEKARLIREMKRVRDEDGSRFNNFQVLNHRYALLNLLGKGGFSEVYKWSEEKKQSYIRHAVREYNIHKTLIHPHIVRLWDIFEIDQNTFCTVLEYCNGKDLDAVLKATPILPEKEARIVIIQIFQVAKVTDFGLSKIVENDVGSQGMELTSQGAGTYWYLPPECFELSKTPLISSKVDVWSAGVGEPEKDAESRRSAMKALKFYATNMDTKATSIPGASLKLTKDPFLHQACLKLFQRLLGMELTLQPRCQCLEEKTTQTNFMGLAMASCYIINRLPEGCGRILIDPGPYILRIGSADNNSQRFSAIQMGAVYEALQTARDCSTERGSKLAMYSNPTILPNAQRIIEKSPHSVQDNMPKLTVEFPLLSLILLLFH